jgi:hypothetical protein
LDDFFGATAAAAIFGRWSDGGCALRASARWLGGRTRDWNLTEFKDGLMIDGIRKGSIEKDVLDWIEVAIEAGELD